MTDLCREVNKFGKGIGNAARYRIVQALLGGRKTVGEITAIVKLSQPAVSQHLKTLRECNIVTDERRGQEVFYTVDTAHTLYLLRHLLTDMKKKPPDKIKTSKRGRTKK
ncbi:MAG: metalloregulator ArsR/SmtB family transcription factor [Candidatus Pacebacteria bacterium]|nr:metalloregulator ArsR/SmtB family transcription factor [Candidatus Paceibacterota bacterium]